MELQTLIDRKSTCRTIPQMPLMLMVFMIWIQIKFKKSKKNSKRIELKNLKNMLVHEDSVAGGYDLMDIVALKNN